MTEKVIQVHNPHNLPTLPYTAFEELPGDLALPMTSQAMTKMRGSLIKHGVFLPTFLWFDDQQRANILDGHQRKTVFGSLAADGWVIPEIPYVSVDASNRKDAAEKLLQIRSRYAQVNPETTWLSEFVEGTNDLIQMLDKVEIPDLDLDSLLTPLDLDDRPDESTLDDLPPEPEHIVIKPGDLIILGNHCLLCGDSTKQEDVDRLMNGELAHLFLTDAPYGVKYADKNRFLNAIAPANRIQEPIENDHQTLEDLQKLWERVCKNVYAVTTQQSAIYWFTCQGSDKMMMMMMSIKRANWKNRHELIWVKNNHVLGRSDYHYKHEPILYGWKQDGTHKFYGDHSNVSTLEFDKPLKSDLHPTMKPVALLQKLISNSSKVHEIVIDPFGG